MRKIVIFYRDFMYSDFSYSLGGIQSYIQLLIRALCKEYKIIVVQAHDHKFSFESNDFSLISLGYYDIKKAISYIEKSKLKHSEDIFLFASEQYAGKTKWENTMVIQHGIYWDLPVSVYNKKLKNSFLQKIFKIFENYRNYKRMQIFKNIVCVDYNYINWYRTITPATHNINFYPILNCASDAFFNAKNNSDENTITVLFARRFVELRGVSILISVTDKLIKKYSHVRVKIAGDGPYKELLHKKFEASEKVSFFNVTYNGMPDFMSSCDIVIVPSLGSEGTSFSAIEAMALGKAVVATNVGGLTNIIIDGYNGILVDINEDRFYESIAHLVENEDYRKKIGKNARIVAEKAFSFEVWSKSWKKVLTRLS